MASAYDQTNQRSAHDSARTLQRLAGDPRLAVVFKQIRAIIGVSEVEMARRLGTDLTTVLNFEAGSVHELPAWPVTAALVERYATLADVDPAPILSHLLQSQTQTQPMAAEPAPTRLPPPKPAEPDPIAAARRAVAQYAPQPAPQPAAVPPPAVARQSPAAAPQGPAQRPASPAIPNPQPAQPNPTPTRPATQAQPPEVQSLGFTSRSKLRTVNAEAPRTRETTAADASPGDVAAEARRRRRRLRNSLLAATPIAALLVLFVIVQTTPRPVYALARALPSVVGTPLRGLADLMLLQTATYRDGLRWIELPDPRTRKGDRLAGR